MALYSGSTNLKGALFHPLPLRPMAGFTLDHVINKLHAVTYDGKLQWTQKTADHIMSSPAIAPDGMIYFGSGDYYLFAMKPEGKALWSFGTRYLLDASALIAPNGNIYIGSEDARFYALRPDGKTAWTFDTQYDIDSSAAIDTEGNVYVGSPASRTGGYPIPFPPNVLLAMIIGAKRTPGGNKKSDVQAIENQAQITLSRVSGAWPRRQRSLTPIEKS